MDGDRCRIAVVFESDIFDRKGLFNAVHGRIKALAALGRYEVVPFCIQRLDGPVSRRFNHTGKYPRIKEMTVDGVLYRVRNYRFSFLDWFLVEKLHRRPFFFPRFGRRLASELQGFDILSAHSFPGALVAREASRSGGAPFFVTWHGSDVHTHPWKNPLIRRETEALTAEARVNFYVSAALLEDSAPFEGRKEVLRNAVNPSFVRLGATDCAALRERYGLSEGTRVVAYAGHFFRIKNTPALPDIFRAVRDAFKGPLVFWVIGDGKEFTRVRDRIAGDKGLSCVFWGNREAAEMPDLFNCIDVLVLPSFNEGLPLVTMEALKCGCNVVGSRVGGIPEVIGEDYTVPLGKGFAEGMASKICECLESAPDQLQGRSFSWAEAAAREDKIYRECLG